MEITEVRITLYGAERLRAFANVIFDGEFIVRGIKVIGGDRGYFVSMPSRQRDDGTHQDVCHPINSRMRERVEAAILNAYEKALDAATQLPFRVGGLDAEMGFEFPRHAAGM